MLTLEEKGSARLVMCMQSAIGSLMHQALALEEQRVSVPSVLLSIQHISTGNPYDVVCIDERGGIEREANTFSLIPQDAFLQLVHRWSDNEWAIMVRLCGCIVYMALWFPKKLISTSSTFKFPVWHLYYHWKICRDPQIQNSLYHPFVWTQKHGIGAGLPGDKYF